MIEVKEKVSNSNHLFTTMDFDDVQKQRLMGKLYDSVNSYYRSNIDSGHYIIDTHVMDGYRYAILVDKETGEVID